ncbi:MAG: hypothetical protein EOM46_16185 [Gammaproteobacteria bacterium]|nr:hypothetical protein [Gammaproteobacteria bacterium]
MTYTDTESDTIVAGVLGAIALVSRADPGLLASLRESIAAGRALTDLPEELREVFAQFDVPALPHGEELTALSRALSIVDATDPTAARQLRDVVLEACEQAAAASGGTSDSERAAITQVHRILSGGGVPDRSGTHTVAGIDATMDLPAIAPDA